VNYPLTSAQLDALAAWWRVGSVTLAAQHLGLAVQTVKNQLATARRRSHADTTLEAVKANWRALAHRYPDDYRRMRYQFDAAYRERVRIQSREAMRRLRTKRAA
jgi:hypothetical protein